MSENVAGGRQGEGRHDHAQHQDDDAPDGAHRARDARGRDDGGAAEESAAPTFEGWAGEDDLELVDLDLGAADGEFGTQKGQLEREDRYGSWWSPGFPEDSPVFTAEPLSIDAEAEEQFGGREVVLGAASGVLVQTILEILDTPLLLEADNSRSGEVAPALCEAFGIAEELRPTFDELFAEVPVSGAYDTGEGLPETYEFEPVGYPADGPRMHLLQAHTEVELLELEELTGPLILASVQGALPVTTADGERPIVRSATYGLGLAADGGNVLMVHASGTAPSVHLADPGALPLVEGTEVPGDWQEHALRDLTVSLPPELGDPQVTEVGLMFSDGERRGSLLRHLLAAPSPYPLSATRHVARAEVPGAELTVLAVGTGLDSTHTVSATIHRGNEHFSVQIHDLTEEESPVVAHQLLAGLRLG